MVLDKIQQENDIKKLTKEELETLRFEIRDFLIDSISKTGGHLASNLGVIELTMALHLCFDLPKDKIIWDVGHQSYTHKILTGRKDAFDTLRQHGGLSGFPKRKESDCDAFDTGHSSTSISAGLGLAEAREILGEDYHVISVIGDGAMTGGLAFEALNNASHIKKNFIIVLNDNEMSISANVGGMNNYLSNFRTANAYRGLKNDVVDSLNRIPGGERMVRKIRNAKNSVKQMFVPGMLFEQMGIIYLGPVDGTNISELCRVFRDAKRVDRPVLVHVLTKKGNGYLPAERHPARFHGTEPFDIKTGLPMKKRTKSNYTDVFATVMKKMGEREPKLVAITAAMETGTGLKRYHLAYPERFFDVGIAEGHAVTFAAGLAQAGLKPLFVVYSSFLQRAYDEILHDVCLQNLPVVFAIDRAGLVGSDGETHQGIYDISYLSTIPNMTVMAPKNKWELSDMLKYAIRYGGPIAIRYPKGEAYDGLREYRAAICYGQAEIIQNGRDVALFALGSMVSTAEVIAKNLEQKGFHPTIINARFAKPFDQDAIRQLAEHHRLIVTMEENVASGGMGEHISDFVQKEKLSASVLPIAIPDGFVEHGNIALLKEELGISADKITDRILEEL
ncbi:MAG: 1-deoxy-D-xylulose-5-phosphate synthase [Lachnospiraceae bacterium]|nr:1-deoxy-D-xylulose-5-phosphate synthase [Lachnospiraceae bacterium]